MKIVVLSRKSTLYSTRRLVEAGRNKGHEVLVIDHAKCVVMMEKGKPAIHYQGESLKNVDAIIPRIGASITFYGSAVVRQFELMDVFTTTGAVALSRSRDKLRSLQIMATKGLGVPKTAFARFPKDKDVEALVKEIGGAPVVIKLLEGTQGLGVVLADSTKAAKSVVEAFSGMKVNVIMQEFIKESKGADIRAFVVDKQVVGAMKRQGVEGEFRSNLHRGGKSEVVQLTRTQERLAIRACRILGLQIAGVDMISSKRGPLILEVNSSPGLEGIEKATGVDIAGKIIEYIERNTIHKPAKKKRKPLDA